MLNVIEFGKDEYEFPALIVLGCFDAIHVGHRDLLKKAKLQAKINGLDLGVMMFKEGKSEKLVYSFEERCAMLEEFNVKFVVAIDFNAEFKAIAPLDFLAALEEKINVKAYMSGKDFRFGAQAKGKSSTLKNYAEDDENGVWYMPVKDVTVDDEKVSTSLIKACLESGDIQKANALLGAKFSLSGEVVHGEGRGTAVVGFPTVNMAYPEWKQQIKQGVYAVKCVVDGAEYTGICNFGPCPTFDGDKVALETYIKDFSGDLYGKTVTLKFLYYIRDIQQFASAEELAAQLQVDLDGATAFVMVEGETAAANAAAAPQPAPAKVEPVAAAAEPAPVAESKPETAAPEVPASAESAPVEEATEAVAEETPADETVEAAPAAEVVEEAPAAQDEEEAAQPAEQPEDEEQIEIPAEIAKLQPEDDDEEIAAGGEDEPEENIFTAEKPLKVFEIEEDQEVPDQNAQEQPAFVDDAPEVTEEEAAPAGDDLADVNLDELEEGFDEELSEEEVAEEAVEEQSDEPAEETVDEPAEEMSEEVAYDDLAVAADEPEEEQEEILQEQPEEQPEPQSEEQPAPVDDAPELTADEPEEQPAECAPQEGEKEEISEELFGDYSEGEEQPDRSDGEEGEE